MVALELTLYQCLLTLRIFVLAPLRWSPDWPVGSGGRVRVRVLAPGYRAPPHRTASVSSTCPLPSRSRIWGFPAVL